MYEFKKTSNITVEFQEFLYIGIPRKKDLIGLSIKYMSAKYIFFQEKLTVGTI